MILGDRWHRRRRIGALVSALVERRRPVWYSVAHALNGKRRDHARLRSRAQIARPGITRRPSTASRPSCTWRPHTA